MTTRLTLVCHASTDAMRTAAFPLAEALDPRGVAKAAELATEFPQVGMALTSPALRARQTAAALQLNATIDPGLRDIDLGRWAGHTLSDVEAREPDAIGAWLTQADAAPHGGESVTDLLDRVAPWLEARHRQSGRILAVTHQAIIRSAVVLAIGAGPAAFWRIDIAPLCRVSLSGNGGRWTLRAILPPGADPV